MKERDRVWVVPAYLTIKAYDEEDAAKRSLEALADGLIEPQFVEDASIGEGPFVELEPISTDSE